MEGASKKYTQYTIILRMPFITSLRMGVTNYIYEEFNQKQN